MKKYTKLNKILFILTIILLLVDSIIFYKSRGYTPCAVPIMILSYSLNNLTREYYRYKTKDSEVSKKLCFLNIFIFSIVLLVIVFNLISFFGN